MRRICGVLACFLVACGGGEEQVETAVGPETGRVAAINATAAPISIGPLTLGPFEGKYLTEEEEEAVGTRREPGKEKVVCVAGRADFTLYKVRYTRSGTGGSEEVESWPSATSVEVPWNDQHVGILEELPSIVHASGSTSRRRLEWTPELGPEEKWSDELRWTILSLDVPHELRQQALRGLWRVSDRRFVPHLLDSFIVSNSAGNKMNLSTLIGLLEPAHLADIDEAVARARSKQQVPLGPFAACYARLDRLDQAAALLPSSTTAQMLFFASLAGAPPEIRQAIEDEVARGGEGHLRHRR